MCHGNVEQVGSLSTRGKCYVCRTTRWTDNWNQLHEHSGPWFDHWRRRTALAVGAVLLDDVTGTD